MSNKTSQPILVVEDDEILRDILVKSLEKEGWEVVSVISAEKALEVLENIKPKVIILDLILPGIDGFEFLEKIKSNEETKEIPVFVLSNFGQKKDIEKAQTLGVEDYIIKAHINPLDFVEKLKNFLKREERQ